VHIDSAKEQLLALKMQLGKTLAKLWRSYDNDGKFKDVDIVQTDNDLQKFSSFRAQFLRALHFAIYYDSHIYEKKFYGKQYTSKNNEVNLRRNRNGYFVPDHHYQHTQFSTHKAQAGQ